MFENNVCRFFGNMVTDVEEKGETKTFGVARMAVDNGYKEKKETLYLSLKFFKKGFSDALYYNIQKGDRVSVEGRLVDDSFTKDDGTMFIRYALIVTWIRKIAKPVTENKDVEGGWYDE